MTLNVKKMKIIMYNETCKYYDVSQFKTLRKEKNQNTFMHANIHNMLRI